MFEDRTRDAILAELLEDGERNKVDTSQGEVFYDSTAGVSFHIARFYADLDNLFNMISRTSAVEEYLDDIGAESEMARNPATPARYKFIYEGTRPSTGERFFANTLYFQLVMSKGELVLEAEDSGVASNYIPPGTPAIPMNTIQGLTLAQFGELLEPGVATEDDDHFRQRIQEKISGPAENGNMQHYKTWCEINPGVGRANIIPLWAGENTVKGILFSPKGVPVTNPIVDEVQEYIDPGGTGLGNGVANIGAHFTAVSAKPLPISVSFTAVPVTGITIEQVRTEAATALTEYLKDIMLSTPDTQNAVVQYTKVGAILFGLPSIMDYANLKVNGGTVNVEVDKEHAAVLEEVTVS